MIRTTRHVTAMAAVLLAVAACGDDASTASTVVETESVTISERVERIEVETESGDVEVVAAAVDEIIVKRTLRHPEDRSPDTRNDVSDRTLVLSHDCSGIDRCSVSYRIETPARVEIQVRVASGNTTVTGIGGDTAIVSASGDITLADLPGDLDIEVTSGRVVSQRLESATALVEAKSGDVELRFVAPVETVEVTNVSGDVRIEVPGGPYRVETKVASGRSDVSVPTSEAAAASIIAETASGDIDIAAP